jgi:hypothetical protein
VPNLISIFRCLGRFVKESFLVRGSSVRFVTNQRFRGGGGAVSPPPNPQAGGPPPVRWLWLLIQYIRSYPPYLEAVCSISNLSFAMPWWKGTNLTWRHKWYNSWLFY